MGLLKNYLGRLSLVFSKKGTFAETHVFGAPPHLRAIWVLKVVELFTLYLLDIDERSIAVASTLNDLFDFLLTLVGLGLLVDV